MSKRTSETTNAGGGEASPPAPKRDFLINRYFNSTRLDVRAFHRLVRAKHPGICFFNEAQHPKRVSTPLHRLDMGDGGHTLCLVPRPSLGAKAPQRPEDLLHDKAGRLLFFVYTAESAPDPSVPPGAVRTVPDGQGIRRLRGGSVWGRYDEGDAEEKKFLSGIVRLITKIATNRHVQYLPPPRDRWLRDETGIIWYGFRALQWTLEDPVHHWLDGDAHPTRDWKFPEGLPWYDPPFGIADDDLSRWP